jgi:hypothetical protein
VSRAVSPAHHRLPGFFPRRRRWGEPVVDERSGRTLLQPRPGARLHLGCGDVYLRGYLNVDYPPGLGVASGASRPDLAADIVTLDAPERALAEVRLHHVFEHFERAVALALLVRWFEWLEPGGVLTVETPDFERCVEGFADRSPEEQSIILRHLFGSQEAPWARHLDGWSARRFREVLARLGFERIDTGATVSDERGLLVNVLVRAEKPSPAAPREARAAAAVAILRQAMNGTNPTEERLAARWVETFERTLADGLA